MKSVLVEVERNINNATELKKLLRLFIKKGVAINFATPFLLVIMAYSQGDFESPCE